MDDESLELMRGTLDLLVLKTVSLSPMHGYDISKWVRQRTAETIRIEDGALYQALRRLEKKRWLEADWRLSPRGREVRFYSLTERGRKELATRTMTWNRYVAAMSSVLQALRI